MSKTVFLVLIIAQIICLAVADAPACKDHPLLTKVSSYLDKIQSNDKSGVAKQKGDSHINDFKNAQPKALTADELDVCSAYAGQKTCCNKKIIKHIDQAALLKTKPVQAAKSAFQKLINIYVTKINSSCSKVINNGPVSAEAIFKNSALTELATLKAAQATCKINFAKALSSFTRGALCSICSGVDSVSNYVNEQGQLKVTQESVDRFVTNTDTAITCYSNIFTEDNLTKVLDQLNSIYVLQNDSCGNTVKTQILETFQKKIANDDGSKGKACKGTIIFGDNSLCENILQGDPNLENDKQKRLLRQEIEEMNRILKVITPSETVIDAQGVNIYVASTTDKMIDENGTSINPSFDETVTPTVSSSSSIIKFAFAFTAIFALVF